MGSQEITLFDLPSKEPCASWSLNPWKSKYLGWAQVMYTIPYLQIFVLFVLCPLYTKC